jgi:hypothetical protein
MSTEFNKQFCAEFRESSHTIVNAHECENSPEVQIRVKYPVSLVMETSK